MEDVKIFACTFVCCSIGLQAFPSKQSLCPSTPWQAAGDGVLGFLPPTWEISTEFLTSSICLVHPQSLQALVKRTRVGDLSLFLSPSPFLCLHLSRPLKYVFLKIAHDTLYSLSTIREYLQGNCIVAYLSSMMLD